MRTPIEPIVTVDDLDAMPDDGNRYEIIGGELFVSRAPGVTHQFVSVKLSYEFQAHLYENPVGVLLTTPGLIFSDIDAVIPDLVFIRNERVAEVLSGERLIGPPDLVIEIVSPGSENQKRDRIAKRQLYGPFGVKEYWIVDPERRAIEIYGLDGQTLKLLLTLEGEDDVVCTVLPGFRCKLSRIFAR